jgi:hypothetical protein
MTELTARQRLLIGIFDRLKNFSMRTLRDRIVVQKTVYFTQQLGAYLGYSYSWYVYGPYSPSLAKDAFAVWSAGSSPPSTTVDVSHLSGVLQNVEDFLGRRSKNAVWLETLGSLHMLSKLYPSESLDDLVDRVLKKAPYFTRPECEHAWSHLVQHGLVDDRGKAS